VAAAALARATRRRGAGPAQGLPEIGAHAVSMLAVESLCIAFGGIRAVADVGFEVGEGELCALIGPNGAGKSTVLNAVSGLVRPDAGRVLFAGRDLTRTPAHRIAALGLARTFQNIALFDHASVIENVLVGRHRHRRSGVVADLLGLPAVKRAERDERDRARAALDSLGLGPQAERMVAELPWGLRKRVELARALASEPRLLLLDEPSAGLSDEERADMATAIERIRATGGPAMLLVEHDMGMVSRLADRAIALDRGRVIAQGPPQAVRKDPAVIEAWLGG